LVYSAYKISVAGKFKSHWWEILFNTKLPHCWATPNVVRIEVALINEHARQQDIAEQKSKNTYYNPDAKEEAELMNRYGAVGMMKHKAKWQGIKVRFN